MSARHAPAAGLALVLGLAVCGIAGARAADAVDPKADMKAFQAYFYEKFPNVKHADFVNGPYSMDEGMRKQWEEKEEFPPYDFAVEKGKELFETPFKNGKTFADCFENGGIGVARPIRASTPSSARSSRSNTRSTAVSPRTARHPIPT